MAGDMLASLAGALVSDGASATGSALASVFGASVSGVIQGIRMKRLEGARDILINEIKLGDKILEDADQVEDLIACLLRYGRAAEEGASRINLRLMAAAINGLYSSSRLISDEFIYYSSILSSLKREEIILIGVLYRNRESCQDNNWNGSGNDPSLLELVPKYFVNSEEYYSWCVACMRTGLVVDDLNMNAPRYRASVLMEKVAQIIDFEEVVRREDQSSNTEGFSL